MGIIAGIIGFYILVTLLVYGLANWEKILGFGLCIAAFAWLVDNWQKFFSGLFDFLGGLLIIGLLIGAFALLGKYLSKLIIWSSERSK